MSENIQYADVPPKGYKLLCFNEAAKEFDLAFYNCESEWRPVKPGQNIIGASASQLWSGVMALARRVPANQVIHDVSPSFTHEIAGSLVKG